MFLLSGRTTLFVISRPWDPQQWKKTFPNLPIEMFAFFCWNIQLGPGRNSAHAVVSVRSVVNGCPSRKCIWRHNTGSPCNMSQMRNSWKSAIRKGTFFRKDRTQLMGLLSRVQTASQNPICSPSRWVNDVAQSVQHQIPFGHLLKKQRGQPVLKITFKKESNLPVVWTQPWCATVRCDVLHSSWLTHITTHVPRNAPTVSRCLRYVWMSLPQAWLMWYTWFCLEFTLENRP